MASRAAADAAAASLPPLPAAYMPSRCPRWWQRPARTHVPSVALGGRGGGGAGRWAETCWRGPRRTCACVLRGVPPRLTHPVRPCWADVAVGCAAWSRELCGAAPADWCTRAAALYAAACPSVDDLAGVVSRGLAGTLWRAALGSGAASGCGLAAGKSCAGGCAGTGQAVPTPLCAYAGAVVHAPRAAGRSGAAGVTASARGHAGGQPSSSSAALPPPPLLLHLPSLRRAAAEAVMARGAPPQPPAPALLPIM